MANWANPQLTSTYTNFVTEVKDRDVDLALQFDGTTSSSIPTNAIRWDSTANRWKKWNGSSWAELTGTYALTGLSTTGAATIGTTLNVTGQTTLATATATTPATADNNTNVATTAFVKAQSYAPLASPTFTGSVTIPSGASIAGYLTTAAAAAGYATVTGGGASGTWGINVSGSAVSATTQDRNTYSTNIATTAYVKNLFGTDSTSGTPDWNHISNTQPGTGPTLLLGTASNGPGQGNYYHPLNFEYGAKNGTQQITQLAISYASPGNELYIRGRYQDSWSSWVRFLNSSNYNSYSPTLTGTGASGTWGINVTGNAANVTGTVAIANGGTGQTSAAAALAALLPSQSGQAGKALVTSGSAATWGTIASGASVQVFTSNGTYTPTAGKTTFLVFATGGGGGYGADGGAYYGEGGGGGTALRLYTSAEMGSTAAVTIGAAGSNNYYGGSGGSTIFDPTGTGLTITGAGGGGGNGDTGATGAGGGSTNSLFAINGLSISGGSFWGTGRGGAQTAGVVLILEW